MLNPGERCIRVLQPWPLATISSYLLTLGLWEIWRRRNHLALTSQRVWVSYGIVLFKTQQSLPLDKVQDVTYSRTFWRGNVLISSAGSELGTLEASR